LLKITTVNFTSPNKPYFSIFKYKFS